MSSAQKHKAKMFVEMANAVDESNARRRHLLQEAHQINAEGVHKLIEDNMTQIEEDEREAPVSKIQAEETHQVSPATPITASSSFDATEEEYFTSPIRHKKRPNPQRDDDKGQSVVDIEQVRRLYMAMIEGREHANLRYQMLELRYLDLSQSLLELESKYRRSEAEKEALQKSCDAMAASGQAPSTFLKNGESYNNAQQQGGHHKNSTVPALQQEMQLLQSQRNKLLQANFELRKHLKQFQQNDTGTCQWCHPDIIFPASLHRPADFVMQEIVQQFHASDPALHSANDDEDWEDEDEGAAAKERDTQDIQIIGDDVQKHDNNLSLLGMQYASEPKNIDWAPPPGSMGHGTSRQQDKDASSRPGKTSAAPTNQKSNPPIPAALAKVRQSTPTLNSILPGGGAPKKKAAVSPKGIANANNIEIPMEHQQNSAASSNAKEITLSLKDLVAKELQDIDLHPVGEGSWEFQVPNLSDTHIQSTVAVDNQYGMIDEFGRSISRKNIHRGSDRPLQQPQKQQRQTNPGMKSLFRRNHHNQESLPVEFRKQTMTQQLSQTVAGKSIKIKQPQQPLPQQPGRRQSYQPTRQAESQPQPRVLGRHSFSQAPHPHPNAAATVGMMQKQGKHEVPTPQHHAALRPSSKPAHHTELKIPSLPSSDMRARSEDFAVPVERGLDIRVPSLNHRDIPFQHQKGGVPKARPQHRPRKVQEHTLPSMRSMATAHSATTEVVTNRNRSNGTSIPMMSTQHEIGSSAVTRKPQQAPGMPRSGGPDRAISIPINQNSLHKDSSSTSMGSYFQRIKKTLQQEI